MRESPLALRLDRVGIRQSTLATALGVSGPAVSRWCKGTRHPPDDLWVAMWAIEVAVLAAAQHVWMRRDNLSRRPRQNDMGVWAATLFREPEALWAGITGLV